jgi:GNAT superfamily N-acetyltransferase
MTAAEADPAALAAFLEEAFGRTKARFILDHGDWWYRDPNGRFLVTHDGELAGCDSKQSTAFLLDGRKITGFWGMDLYVRPAFRGKGLQSLLYRSLPEGVGTVIGFPTTRAAERMAHLGSGIRDDMAVLAAALRPLRLDAVRNSTGIQATCLRIGALSLSPPAALFRARASRYRPRRTEAVEIPNLQVLEDIFRRHAVADMATTIRDSDHLRWRYADAPYRSELRFYLTGPRTGVKDGPTHYAITRHLRTGETVKVRILDVFGDFSDREGLVDLFRTIVRDAVKADANCVMVLACLPEITRAAWAAGLVLSTGRRFEWRAADRWVHERLGTTRLHWTLADGDNDAPFD